MYIFGVLKHQVLMLSMYKIPGGKKVTCLKMVQITRGRRLQKLSDVGGTFRSLLGFFDVLSFAV